MIIHKHDSVLGSRAHTSSYSSGKPLRHHHWILQVVPVFGLAYACVSDRRTM
ncbi:hypothetical protein BO70DRAFT_363131 [Aspergillus heteromorphus CBS 117.55]|uniref:Uncharacterized protein n=1 Tax=Aspergillus heteromorphus CBS 117.55 TaxID=1448321 RepID=A0A317VYZ6_9EURO|nr:uncharacterized protein BO70DRAFT_363131 [Aspergillus heteromorphus CBS 117.55]PWY78242.1 hypothetical protein BO70DRAFT_363131 [Aspergillus heteromorphus CBS 117.55]